MDEQEAGGALAEPTGREGGRQSSRLSAARAWSFYRTVFVVGVLGLLGLGLGLWLSNGRTKPPDSAAPQRPDDEVIPASQLAGLGYLPADTNIVFAAQPGPALAYARRIKQEPRDVIVKAGLPRQVLDTVAALGVSLSQIDHIAGGTHLGDGAFELRFTLVLVLHKPLADEDQFLAKLKAKKQPTGNARYAVEFGGLSLTLARVLPTVWVFGFEGTKDLAAVDRGGYGAGGKQFRPALVEMIDQRVPPSAAAWFATDDDRWAEKPGVKLAAQLMKKPEWLPVLARGRAAVAALSFGEEPRVRLFVRTADEATGQQLRDYLKELAVRDEKAQHGGGGELAFFDAPIDPANAFATLQRFLADAKK